MSAGDVREHYRAFHEGGVEAGPAGADLPLLVVLGNCQAESLRLLLAADDVATVRVPPTHELTAEDVPALHRLLRRADLVVAQPTADGHRGLPVGTAELLALARASVRHALVNPVRFAGLHPTHVVVHPPGLAAPEPPVVAYHDLRTAVAAAWDRAGTRPPQPWSGLQVGHVRAVGELSRAELRRREQRHGSVVVSDLLAHPTADTMRTVNHPGNVVLAPVASRLRLALGLAPRPPAVTRPLLDAVHAPLERAVVAAYDLPGGPRADWRVDGSVVGTDRVERAHRRFYRERPDVLDAVLERGRPVLDVLDLPLPEPVAGRRG